MNSPSNRSFAVTGQLVDIHQRRIFPAKVTVKDGIIEQIEEIEDIQLDYWASTKALEASPGEMPFIMPGFVDAHVHIESSMLTPTEFARLAVMHGTVATVSDPHEIGNVLGVEGVRFMIENGKLAPFKFYFGAPSCVPATSFETAGAVIDLQDVRDLLAMPEVKYLAEMMNFPGVLYQDPEVMGKIQAAKDAGKPIDGHAPGLRGEDAKCYFEAGISTDHECFTLEEARDKAKLGVKILIREGSAAKNFEALHPIISEFPHLSMFCSDDKHPDGLLLGHVNLTVARAIAHRHDLFDVLRAASLNPVAHYGLEVGLLRVGDPADFVVMRDLVDFEALETYIEGELVSQNGQTNLKHIPSLHPNHFEAKPLDINSLPFPAMHGNIRVIVVEDGQLVTLEGYGELPILNGNLQADPSQDILKMVVLNRYKEAAPSIAFVKNFGLKSGAIAGSVAHDSHNVIAVGVSDEDIAAAINLVIESKGGLSLANGTEKAVLPLPVAGLMTDADGFEVAKAYTLLDHRAKALGATLASPYMTLSFCALLVIPELKLSDKGLFDGKNFQFTTVLREGR